MLLQFDPVKITGVIIFPADIFSTKFDFLIIGRLTHHQHCKSHFEHFLSISCRQHIFNHDSCNIPEIPLNIFRILSAVLVV